MVGLTDFDVFCGYDAHPSTAEACWGYSIDFNAVGSGPVDELGMLFAGV